MKRAISLISLLFFLCVFTNQYVHSTGGTGILVPHSSSHETDGTDSINNLKLQNTYTVVGEELSPNVTFENDSSGWSSDGDCITYNSGTKDITVSYDVGNSVFSTKTTISVEEGKIYKISFTISSSTTEVYLYCNNNGWSLSENVGDGSYTYYFMSEYTGEDEVIYFEGNTWEEGNHFNIDNISIIEVELVSGLEILNPSGNSIFKLSYGEIFDDEHSLYSNIYIGYNNLLNNTSGSDNLIFGNNNLKNNTIGGYNLAIGGYNSEKNIDGNGNIGIGNGNLRENISGNNNIGIGSSCLGGSVSGSDNIAIGNYSLLNNNGGNYNIAIGLGSLVENSSDYNIAIGYQSLNYNTYGTDNIAIGKGALASNNGESADDNIAIGKSSLYTNYNGYMNVSIGNDSLRVNTIGKYGVSIGFQSLYKNTEGDGNVSIGYLSLFDNTEGAYNTSIGAGSLQNNTIGVYNIGIGSNSGQNLTTGNYNITIGNNTTFLSATGDYQLNIGNLIYGDMTYNWIALATAGEEPSTPSAGWMYFNGTNYFYYNGSAWQKWLDWSQDQGATNIHSGNIPDLSGTYELANSNNIDPDRLNGDSVDDDLIDSSLIGPFQEIIQSSTDTLTASEVRGTLINNYGQAEANTQTLPTAAKGYSFKAIIGTSGMGAFNIKAGASDKIYFDGTALDDGDKVSCATPVVGNQLTCWTFQTGAGAYDWICETGRGTWTDGGA